MSIPFAITTPVGLDPFDNPRFSAVGRVVLNRRDFGVNGPDFWNRAISDSVEIESEVGCRRWNYDQLGWGSTAGPVMAPRYSVRRSSCGPTPRVPQTSPKYAASERSCCSARVTSPARAPS